jgi:hypothetical protein
VRFSCAAGYRFSLTVWIEVSSSLSTYTVTLLHFYGRRFAFPSLPFLVFLFLSQKVLSRRPWPSLPLRVVLAAAFLVDITILACIQNGE